MDILHPLQKSLWTNFPPATTPPVADYGFRGRLFGAIIHMIPTPILRRTKDSPRPSGEPPAWSFPKRRSRPICPSRKQADRPLVCPLFLWKVSTPREITIYCNKPKQKHNILKKCQICGIIQEQRMTLFTRRRGNPWWFSSEKILEVHLACENLLEPQRFALVLPGL